MSLTKIVHREVSPILFQGLAWSLPATLWKLSVNSAVAFATAPQAWIWGIRSGSKTTLFSSGFALAFGAFLESPPGEGPCPERSLIARRRAMVTDKPAGTSWALIQDSTSTSCAGVRALKPAITFWNNSRFWSDQHFAELVFATCQ